MSPFNSEVYSHALTPGGQFTASGAPSGMADCLQGNLCWALVTLGYDLDRLAPAIEWMARSVTGEGVAPREDRHATVRYYAGKCGPTFACGTNKGLPCAWGADLPLLPAGVQVIGLDLSPAMYYQGRSIT